MDQDIGHVADSWQEAKGRIPKARLASTRNRENIRAILERAASEQPPPRLSDVARRLKYIKLDQLYRVDAALCRRIASNYQKTLRDPGTRATDKRFCSLAQMRRALEESLAQDLPTSPYHVALELGFVSDNTLRRKFPVLCHAIQEKIDKRNALRIVEMERALTAALAEDPPPSLGEMCQRLGNSRPVVLRKHSSELCDQLLELRRAHRVRKIEKLKSQLYQFILEFPAVSLEHACRRVGYSRQQLLRLCPEECTLVVANFDRSSHDNSQRKLEELQYRAHQIVTTLHQQGKLPSFKRVSALLGSVLNNWREQVAAIRVAKAELANRLPDFAQSGFSKHSAAETR